MPTKNPTIVSKIRRALRDMHRAPEGMFTFDRELGLDRREFRR